MTKLTHINGAPAIVLDQQMLDELNIDADTPLEITAQTDRLVITRQSTDQIASREGQLRQALAETNVQYGRMLKRLAE